MRPDAIEQMRKDEEFARQLVANETQIYKGKNLLFYLYKAPQPHKQIQVIIYLLLI